MLQQFYPTTPHNKRFELNKDMHFAAAHLVPHPSAGKCQQLHGHTYFVNITIVGDEVGEDGFLVNFQSLKKLVHKKYDHTVLNDHHEFDITDGGTIPSTENVAEWIYITIQHYLDSEGLGAECLQVILRETPTSYVVYRPKHN